MTDKDKLRACCIPARQADAISRNQSAANKLSVSNTAAAILSIDTVSIGGDRFEMGSTDSAYPEDGEFPVRNVWVDAFKLSTTAVSNREFQSFVKATNYKTNAEQAGSSFVFHLFVENAALVPASRVAPWWCDVAGACWRSPEGVGSSIENRLDHPVVHVTREDALQYCRWSGTRLATEAEWEYAARGGLLSQAYPWGSQLLPKGDHHCNIWQGDFPNTNTGDDGYVGTAPVRAFTANGYGLFNMTGNVWEWVSDRFTNMHSPRQVNNPRGPLNGNRFVAKGGSYLCHESYCLRYRTSSRQALVRGACAGNLGFRVALDTNQDACAG